MDRRGFLQFVEAVVVGAALPKTLQAEKIARFTQWPCETKILFRVSEPLAAGAYTFMSDAGDKGMYVGGVKAAGGETLFEMPEGTPIKGAQLLLGGLTYGYRNGESIDLWQPTNPNTPVKASQC